MPRKPADYFRRNVARIMFERGMTQAELAKLSETKPPNISRILAGLEQVSLERAGRIAKALKVPLSRLVSAVQTEEKILQEIA